MSRFRLAVATLVLCAAGRTKVRIVARAAGDKYEQFMVFPD